MAEIKLKMLRGTIVEKKPAKIGQIVSVSKKDADYLIRTGKAKLAESSENLEDKKSLDESGDLKASESSDTQVPSDVSDESEQEEKKPKKGRGK